MGYFLGGELGRWLRQYPNGDLYAKILAGLVFFGVIGFILLQSAHRKRIFLQGAFQGITLLDETDTLHIFPRGAVMPRNIRTQLRRFNDADDLYYYVYKKFDEVLFQKVILHCRTDTPPIEFVPDVDQTADANQARLRELMGIM